MRTSGFAELGMPCKVVRLRESLICMIGRDIKSGFSIYSYVQQQYPLIIASRFSLCLSLQPFHISFVQPELLSSVPAQPQTHAPTTAPFNHKTTFCNVHNPILALPPGVVAPIDPMKTPPALPFVDGCEFRLLDGVPIESMSRFMGHIFPIEGSIAALLAM
jgi:hypothetical protein